MIKWFVFIFLGWITGSIQAQLDTGNLKSPEKKNVEGIDTVYIQSESLMTIGDMNLRFTEKQIAGSLLPNSLSDPVQLLKILPGVSNSQEMNSGIYVRGGTANSSSIYWNDVPIPNLSHSFGLLSIFNTNTVSSVDYFNTEVSGYYGSRGSSYFKFNGVLPDNRKFKTECNINPISSDIYVSAPIIKGKLAFNSSVRKSFFTSVLNENVLPVFSDFIDHFSQIHWNISPNHSMKISVVQVTDDRKPLEFDGLLDFNDSNYYKFQSVSVQHEGKLSNNLTWKNTLFKNAFGNSYFSRNYSFLSIDNKQDEFNFKSILNMRKSLMFKQVGLEWSSINSTNRLQNNNDSIWNDQSTQCISAFVDMEHKLDKWEFSLNGRISHLGKTNLNIYPEYRFGVKCLVSNHFNVFIHYNTFVNFKHVVSGNLLSAPNDYTFYSNEHIRPNTTEEGLLGINWKSNRIQLKSTIYFRSMSGIYDFNELNSDNYYFQSNLSVGIGKSMGWESVLTAKIFKTTDLYCSYTLSSTKFKNESIEMGSWYSSNWDRPHLLHVTINQDMKIGKWVVNFDLQSGRPITRPLFLVFYTGSGTPVFSRRNSYRLPLYHKMDVGFQFKPIKKKQFTQTFGLYVYNAYVHQNVYGLIFAYDYNSSRFVGQYLTLFPILPTINYKISLN